MNCPLCSQPKLSLKFELNNIPVFQNKVYKSIRLSQKAQTANIKLMLCKNCGFVFNSDFDISIMNYDTEYQNEQAHSPYFQNYLDDILRLFLDRGFYRKKIIEIGCGKGFFLEKLKKYSFEVTGFDPAYEGENPYIIKDYFNEKYSYLNADLILLRHVLEHIKNPLNFLHNIAKATDGKGQIFIEVPSFEWILQKEAFWDICYEHCNYFTSASLGNIFQKSKKEFLFNNQYMYLLADLRDLRLKVKPSKTNIDYSFSVFKTAMKKYEKFVREHQNIIVWGAGAKGVTFANVIDPNNEYISHIIDINPKKQNYYIAKTAHKIYSPSLLDNFNTGNIIIMNENYFDEIKQLVGDANFNFFVLGKNQ